MDAKWLRDGNLLYTLNDKGSNDLSIQVISYPRNDEREVAFAKAILDLVEAAEQMCLWFVGNREKCMYDTQGDLFHALEEALRPFKEKRK